MIDQSIDTNNIQIPNSSPIDLSHSKKTSWEDRSYLDLSFFFLILKLEKENTD